MRVISDPNQAAAQDSIDTYPVYKVEGKPNELSAEDYEDITNLISDLDILRTIEGKANTASFKIANTDGIYDIVNVNSVTCNKFKSGTKIKISAGYSTPDQLLFTGYIEEGYKPAYQLGKKEEITIKASDRFNGTVLNDYTKKITTVQFWSPLQSDLDNMVMNNTLGRPVWDGGSMGILDFLSTFGEKWTVKRILEYVLVVEGGMDISDIDIDSELDFKVEFIQFVEESIQDIILLCAQTKLQAAYFDVDGTFKTRPMQFSSVDWNFSGTSQGTLTNKVDHNWNTSDLLSRITVIGGVSYSGRESEKKIVFNVDPYFGPRGINSNGAKQQFEDDCERFYGSGILGNPMYDSLWGSPFAADADKKYGIGIQGTIVPEGGGGVFDLVTQWHVSGPGTGINDQSKWTKVLQGPFQWTIDGKPAEPYQNPKTGIGDGSDMGPPDYGFFTRYNTKAGTITQINPTTLQPITEEGLPGAGYGKQFPVIIQKLMGKKVFGYPLLHHWYGILPSKDVWDRYWKERFEESGYPQFEYPIDVAIYNGPTSEIFYTFTYCCWDATISYRIWDSSYREWSEMNEIINTAWQWGLKYEADQTELPAEHWKGTSTDTELFGLYGTTRIDEVENPLLFGTSLVDDPNMEYHCTLLGSRILERLKYFHIQSGITLPFRLDIEPLDLIAMYNPRINCIEKTVISTIKYSFGKSKKALMQLSGGFISSNGTTVKAYV